MDSAFERNYIEKGFAKSMHHKDRNIMCILLGWKGQHMKFRMYGSALKHLE